MTTPPIKKESDVNLIPELIDERLASIHKVVRALNEDDYSKDINVFPKDDSFTPLEKDFQTLVQKVKGMNKTTEMAMSKIKEALAEIIQLTNTVKLATESIKAGKFEVPFDTESKISEVKELKKRFQYLISVIRLLSAESVLTDK